jgi:2-keto-4-pentenoate hydratase/2-oxohepta-3-ene-1,7-dioic acid hydratase in catechol pathway
VSFEGELALVISRICKEVPIARASEVIFGYTIANDVTARDLQKTDGQWARAKGYDTFCPLGPWITTHQSLEEVAALPIRTTLDGELRQDGNTKDMIFTIPELVAYISSYTRANGKHRDRRNRHPHQSGRRHATGGKIGRGKQ